MNPVGVTCHLYECCTYGAQRFGFYCLATKVLHLWCLYQFNQFIFLFFTIMMRLDYLTNQYTYYRAAKLKIIE